jgi:hypothetical protein
MDRKNIYEVTNLTDLRSILESNLTVVLGLTTPNNSMNEKIIIRKFLKRKSEKFPLITFVYMEVSDKNRKALNILNEPVDKYPLVYHIRNGNNILITIPAANEYSLNESFAEIEGHYIAEMQEFRKQYDEMFKGKKTKNTTDDINNGDNNDNNDDNDNNDNNDNNDDNDNNDNNDNVDNNDNNDNKNEDDKIEDKSEANNNNKYSTESNLKSTAGNFQPNKNKSLLEKNKQNTNTITNVDLNLEEQIDPVLEKKKNLEKLILLNKKNETLKIDLMKEVARRKKIEAKREKKKAATEKKDTDGKEYRKSVRRTGKA